MHIVAICFTCFISWIACWHRYQESYEQKLDPFSNFSKQEKQRKYGQLSVFEKVLHLLFFSWVVVWKRLWSGDPVPCAVYCEQQNCPLGCVLLLRPTSWTRLCRPLQTRLDRIMQVSNKTNIFGNLNKYIWQFWQIHLAMGTNTFVDIGQIHLALWKNTFGNLVLFKPVLIELCWQITRDVCLFPCPHK